MQADYVNEYEDFEERHWWFSARRTILGSIFDRYVPGAAAGEGRWLDVGCNTGVMLHRYPGFAERIGVELNAVSAARGKAKGLDVRTTALSWDFTEFGHLDCVSLFDVIEHVEREAPAIDAVRAVLKKGGLLVISVPALMSLWSDHDVVNHHFRRYTAKNLLKLFPCDQWDVLKISYFSSLLFPFIWSVRTTKCLTKRFKSKGNNGAASHDFKFGPPLVDRMLEGIFRLEKPWLRVGSFPIGSSILLVLRKKE